MVEWKEALSSSSRWGARSNSNLLLELFYQGRHYKISLVVTTQIYHAVQSALLANASAIILFRLKTKMEQEAGKVLQELRAGGMSRGGHLTSDVEEEV